MAFIQDEDLLRVPVHHVGEPNYPIWVDKGQRTFHIDLSRMQYDEFYYLDKAEDVVVTRESEFTIRGFSFTDNNLKVHLERMQK